MNDPAMHDVMDRLAGLPPGSPLAELRRQRPEVVRHTQGADDAVFSPHHDGGLLRVERAAAALRIATLLSDTTLRDHYAARLARLDPPDDRFESVEASEAADRRWATIIGHVGRVTSAPDEATRDHINNLLAAGLSPQAVVALSQLIAYVSFQSRVLASLRMLRDAHATTELGAQPSETTAPASKPIRDFTQGELDWRPWIAPVELEAATAEQRDALKITPSSRAVGAYSLVLAHDPETLNQRSPLYNGIMFGPRGLPRADRELGAVVASRINGCAYCAAVHAKRFGDLTKEPEVMRRIHAEGVETSLDPRRKAIVDYAAKLTRSPAAIGAGDLAPLRAQDLSGLEILDLTHAVAMFAWANRLMQSLGEPAPPGAL